MPIAIRTSQNVLLEYEPASIGERILAILIDYLVFLGWFLLTVAIPAGMGITPGTFYIVVVLLPLMFYHLLCESLLNGRSLGKIALGIRVVMLDGSSPTLGAYLIRWVLRLIESISFMGGLIPIITVAINGKGQRLGDIAAGTTVVRLKPAVSLHDVQMPVMPEHYVVQFPDVHLLNDRDITIIRSVLRQGDESVLMRTAIKIKDVTGIQSTLSNRAFLETVISDYQFISTT
ncbi:RDD family protein [Spirosoma daeguense]